MSELPLNLYSAAAVSCFLKRITAVWFDHINELIFSPFLLVYCVRGRCEPFPSLTPSFIYSRYPTVLVCVCVCVCLCVCVCVCVCTWVSCWLLSVLHWEWSIQVRLELSMVHWPSGPHSRNTKPLRTTQTHSRGWNTHPWSHRTVHA